MIPILVYGRDDASRVFRRTQLDDAKVTGAAAAIIADVRARGDEALFEYAAKFDGVRLDASNIAVTEEEIDAAVAAVPSNLLDALKRAKDNILNYHARQRDKFRTEIFDVAAASKLGWIYRPMERAGLYVPGGKASYPSTVLMTALPAVAAGVGEVVVTSPNPKNPLILAACRECGIKRIFKVGGAQAIAAMAYGTDSVPRVDIVAGPGNVYVTAAKKQVFGSVAVDMIAGPSEICVVADETADPERVAADLLSQAEHDESAASILVTPSYDFAVSTAREIARRCESLPRREIVKKSLEANGAAIVVRDLDEALEVADAIAPEHLEVWTKDADKLALRVRNAGAIFVGGNSPEPLGDYVAGPSHVLPTSGSARFSSVLSVDTFMKKISYIDYSARDLAAAADDIIALAQSEGFDAHANAVKARGYGGKL